MFSSNVTSEMSSNWTDLTSEVSKTCDSEKCTIKKPAQAVEKRYWLICFKCLRDKSSSDISTTGLKMLNLIFTSFLGSQKN